MPIYEYQCQLCGHQLEIIHKMNDPHATDCPECGESGLKKKVSAAAFRLKGGGWYETDFKSGDKKKNLVDTKGESGADKASGTDNKGSAGGKDGKSGGKSDTKASSGSDSGNKTKPSSSSSSSNKD